ELNHTTTFHYDDYKRLTSITTPQRGNGDTTTPTTNFWYDWFGTGVTYYTHTDSNVTRLVLPSSKTTRTLYDENMRKYLQTVAVDTTDAATTTWSYDPVGNL